MTKSEMVDISHLIETVPSEEAHMILVGMKRTLARVADALEHWEVDQGP